ncbi:uncharacterized protein [Fopius arisanus]|uniref:WD repeat-containing protein 52 n=1 Tax=Fopius arisanus TaxID=64838 RepID=A0A9R1TEJ3_9HYME|nr:PREDICTED: uncharacterized protein LOC105269393 [Fopius arisanus]
MDSNKLIKTDNDVFPEDDYQENASETQVQMPHDSDNNVPDDECVENGSVINSPVQFNHSYGYDCRRYFNLCVPDPNTLIFSSGAFIHFYDVVNNRVTFKRCSMGTGIGHIAKNPQESHIAVGETGENPPIIIYKWPSMNVITVLQNGTKKNYSHLAYSPDGKLLLSQGCSPDYLITIWNWIKSIPLLRCKSHEQDIHNAIFSPSVPGHLVTSGSGHIKFWKISKTFTGLKLEDKLGKFGRTEISDIIGLYSMPDEKVISGCEWGNILIWEDGLIKLEVRRKNNKPCHLKMITQFEYYNGDLMSIGMDGWLRVWSYETIDQTDVSQDKGFIEIEPINEFEVNIERNLIDVSLTSTMIMSLKKKDPKNDNDKEWYAQDGNGGLWLVDLSTFDDQTGKSDEENGKNKNATRQLLRCHAGPVMDMSVCTWSHYLATIGSDCYLHIYNYVAKKLIITHKFNDEGSSAVWLPCSLDKTGSTIICGFHSGVIRVVAVAIASSDNYEPPTATRENKTHLNCLQLIQVVKPHTNEVTTLTLNVSSKLLITGSEDSTIFLFSIQNYAERINLIPIGFIKVPSGITRINWKPDNSSTILIGCTAGHFGEIELPKQLPLHNKDRQTYQLDDYQAKFFKFRSIKSALKREIVKQQVEKQAMERLEAMKKKLEEYKSLNPGVDIDEEVFLEDIEDPLPLPDIYVPSKPNPVQNIDYTNTGNIWISMGGYDAGYIYEYPSIKIEQTNNNQSEYCIEEVEPLKATPLQDADDLELQSFLLYNDTFIILGIQHGQLRICRVDPNNFTNFSHHLCLPMHDYYHGYMKKILLSYDEQYLFTCGYDGNIFSYLVNFCEVDSSVKIQFESHDRTSVEIRGIQEKEVDDIRDVNYPSLEQVLITAESNRIMTVTKKNRDDMYHLLRNLTKDYQAIMERNKALIKSQQIPPSNFILDNRIVNDLNSQLKYEMDLITQRMAFKLEKSKLILKKLMDHFVSPITCLPFAVCRTSKPDKIIHSVKEKKLDEDFQIKYADILQNISQTEDSRKYSQDNHLKMDKSEDQEEEMSNKEEEIKGKIDGIVSYLQDQYRLLPDEGKLTVEMKQILRRYNVKRIQMEKRAKEWKIMHEKKPDPNCDHPDDVRNVENARNTIGDYKLKVSSDYNRKCQQEQETTLVKYKQLLDCRKQCHYLREVFNDRLKSVRSKKISIQNEIDNLAVKKLHSIHSEIGKNSIKELPEMRQIDDSIEYPENNLKMEKYVSMGEKVKEARRQKQSIIEETMEQGFDEELKMIITDESILSYYSELVPTSLNMRDKKRIKEVEITVPESVQRIMEENDRTITPWEREMKTVRLSRKLYEQDCIIKNIEMKYEEIDRELDELENDRLAVHVDGVYFELYKLTLNQELLVLQDCEIMENSLREKVNNKIQDKQTTVDKLQLTMKNIDKKNRYIKMMQTKIKEQTGYFMNAVHDNKYSKFLTRIFKKKIKTNTSTGQQANSSNQDSSDSSDSSDETSTDEQYSDGSIDIHKIALTTFDENVCPTDCSQELYDLAFSMRLMRHNNENEIRDEQKNVETLMREVEYYSKQIQLIEAALQSNEKILNDFLYDKQCKLNDIDITLTLNFHQLEHFVDDDNLENIFNCVVFDMTRLSQLYTRVGELQRETYDQTIRHKQYCTHLHRMNIDCKYMKTQIKKLKSEINGEMIKKFGCPIALASLYEAVIRKLIYNIRANMNDNLTYEKQFKCLKERYDEHILILENLIRDNTEKLSILTVLTEEQMKFHKIIKKSPQSSKSIFQSELEWRKDLCKLERIIIRQKEQKEFFRNDVRNLKLKIRSLPPIVTREKYPSSVNKFLNKNSSEQEATASVKDQHDSRAKKTICEMLKDKHDSVFRIVKNLLLKIIHQYVEGQEADSIVDLFFHEILKRQSNVSSDFIDSFMDICEKIEKRIEEIATTTGIADKIREIIVEYANEIISQLEIESQGVGVGSVEISWNVKPKLDEFLDSMKIKKDITTEVYVMKFLKMEMGVELATDYVLTKLSKKPDSETMIAFREHASRTLREIQKHIDGESETETTVQSSNSGP